MSQAPLVIHIIHSLGAGGMENGLVNIINRMPADRYRHGIICLTRSGEFASRIERPDVQIHEIHQRPGHDLAAYWRLWKLLYRLKPAIVHTRNLSALEMQLVAAMVPGVRRLHGEHGRDIYDLEGKNRKYNLLRQFMSRVVQHYICVSRDLEQWLHTTIGVPAAKVSQIYNGVDGDRFGEASVVAGVADFPAAWNMPDAVIAGSVGRLVEVKNQASMLQALALIRDRDPILFARLKLVLVGDGPLRAELEALCAKLGLEQNLWLAGNRDDVADLLGKMDFFMLPSLGEGISNTILEAMAMKLPVIATAVGGNVELVEDGVNGLLVPVASDAVLADAMMKLAESPELREEMGENGYQMVGSQFQWPVTVNHYMAVYDRLLQQAV
ncbi:TIGR03088 family PEP-CTERM/XrtA system glycosyltransferase [Pseudomaricurvus sp. HS19]|uniref:TIGR03088 family PEP-CTERM/XrtA system glycosyltransferase n=1 Tax=Pseudomaricurvus sp. HS19 TaxID=2692626 RepID=UPI0013721C78|nr:TIGR03088 family PEP-CTERM/XrtA system glycosyltransferase [Pseudomaricurvus sp. HS19]MYM62030.1 TIGR03088 family PEP-CTERM/XrtA system glycosyltransferase [Pseudomaricurvus sp. HS19]